MKIFKWLATGLLGLTLALPACRRQSETVADTPALLLLCGAGLRPPVEAIAAAYEREQGERIDINFGASNLLLGQLELTARGDLFLPGDAFYIDEASRRGRVAASQTVAWFVPVIQVAAGNPLGIRSVADLVAPGRRLALADERAAAIGRITPDIFRAHGVAMETVRQRTVFTAVTAPELGQAVALGHADAAINWRPVAMQFDESTDIVSIPADRNVVSPVGIAVLTTAGRPEAARAFMRFMTGPVAREIFRQFHYHIEPET